MSGGAFPTREARDAYLDQLVAEMEALRKDNDKATKDMALRIDRSLQLARQAREGREGVDEAAGTH